jgi:threonine dehydratase
MFGNKLRYYDKLRMGSDIYKYVVHTPITYGYNLSNLTNNNILYKREDMQPVFSFKIRGACLKINSLTDIQKQNGLVLSSAGNHAQGVSYISNKLKIYSTIIMPVNTPQIKIDLVKKFGGKYVNIILFGDVYDDAYHKALEIEKSQNKTMIKPFDDDHVIAGNSTIAYEIWNQFQNVDKIFIPCGGGALLAGLAVGIKYLNPNIKIIGVEAENTAGMTESLKNNKVTSLKSVDSFADGCAVKTVGDITFNLCNEYVDDMITVNNNEICNAIKLAFDDTRVLLEPAGALSIAGIYKYTKKHNIINKNILGILSGANCNFSRFKFITDHNELNEKLVLLKIKEEKGSFYKLYNIINDLKGIITEFNYKCTPGYNKETADIFMSFKSDTNDFIIKTLSDLNYDINDLTDNDLTKDHIRYMSINNNIKLKTEKIIRFEFPNNTYNLKQLLSKLDSRWNISLFHYKNSGSDISKILIGFKVLKKDEKKFIKFLDTLSYKYYDETYNYDNILKK